MDEHGKREVKNNKKNEQNKTTKVKRMTDMTLDFRVVVMQGYNKNMQRYCHLLDINITGVSHHMWGNDLLGGVLRSPRDFFFKTKTS